MRFLTTALALMILLCGSTRAQASTIQIDGMTFDLTLVGLTNPASPSGSYDFQLTLNSSGYVAPVGSNQTVVGTDYLSGFAIDFGTTIAAASSTAPSGWALTTGGVNTTGCQNGPNDTLCASTTQATTLLNGTNYTWLFSVDFAGDGNYSPPSVFTFQTLIGGSRLSSNGNVTTYTANTNSVSGTLSFTPPPPAAPVPEPASLLMLGSGLLLAVRLRRRPAR